MNSIDEKGVNKSFHDNSKEDMENGTYEVIKNRLLKKGSDLKERVESLIKKEKVFLVLLKQKFLVVKE